MSKGKKKKLIPQQAINRAPGGLSYDFKRTISRYSLHRYSRDVGDALHDDAHHHDVDDGHLLDDVEALHNPLASQAIHDEKACTYQS